MSKLQALSSNGGEGNDAPACEHRDPCKVQGGLAHSKTLVRSRQLPSLPILTADVVRSLGAILRLQLGRVPLDLLARLVGLGGGPDASVSAPA